MWRGTATRWGPVAQGFHWVMALLFAIQIALGWTAVGWRLSPTKLDLFVWHKSLGLLMLALAALRLVWRLSDRQPAPPAMPTWQRRTAAASHTLLYLLMFAIPLSGWLLNSAANIPLKWFWWVPVPNLVDPDRELRALAADFHLALFWLLAAVLAVHVAAALKHHLVNRDAVLRRMLPGRGA